MNRSIHVVIIHARIINSLIIVVHIFNNNSMNIGSASDRSS